MRCGIACLITELPEPLSVRRLVSFSTAIQTGSIQVERMTATRVKAIDEIHRVMDRGDIPVIADPALEITGSLRPAVVIDARLRKRYIHEATLSTQDIIGLGPGFIAGVNCLAVIETNRGPNLGRVIWHGSTEPDTGRPEQVQEHSETRVLRAPAEGHLQNRFAIQDLVRAGDIITTIDGYKLCAAFDGVIRGLLVDGTQVKTGMKIGDIDPRGKPELAIRISDKALAVGGGVLEAVLMDIERRKLLLGRP